MLNNVSNNVIRFPICLICCWRKPRGSYFTHFHLFLEDLEMSLQGNTYSGILIDALVLIILLFADDMAIFENNPEDFQNNLNLLHDYCNTWGLEVNCDKTKSMVSRKRVRLTIDFFFFQCGSCI